MQRHRFFAPPKQIHDSAINLDSEESHHLTRVLRLTPGEIVYAFDGEGAEYECEIIRVGKELAGLKVLSRLSNEIESPLELTVGQAVVKGDKFDWIVQKATELGATRIIPLITAHTEFRKAEGWEQRLQRWRRIALEATKQCGRRKLTEISEVQKFDQFCANQLSTATRLLFSERSGKQLSDVLSAAQIVIAIGPEGGWSDQELELAEHHKFLAVHLGNRILRTETAAIAAISLTQYLFGDLQ